MICVFDTTDFIPLAFNKYNFGKLISGGIHVKRHKMPLRSYILLNIYAIYCICISHLVC